MKFVIAEYEYASVHYFQQMIYFKSKSWNDVHFSNEI